MYYIYIYIYLHVMMATQPQALVNEMMNWYNIMCVHLVKTL